MNTDVRAAQEDLAFLRALVERSDGTASAWAEGYFFAGLIYGAQMLMHAAQFFGLLPGSGLGALAIGLGPTLVFLPVMAWISWRHRAEQPATSSSRAIGAVFGAVGATTLGMIIIIGWAAWRQHSLATWLIYPASVFLLQSAAWMVAWRMRRQAWLGLVAAGWFVFAIGMGLTTDHLSLYVLFCGLGIWTCMALPGWVLMRSVAKPA
jgi:hypothetical protein